MTRLTMTSELIRAYAEGVNAAEDGAWRRVPPDIEQSDDLTDAWLIGYDKRTVQIRELEAREQEAESQDRGRV